MPPPTETCRRLPAVGKVSTNTSSRPDSYVVYAIHRPSGETCAWLLLKAECEYWTAAPCAPTGCSHKSEGLPLPRTIHLPSGDQSHSTPATGPIRLSDASPRTS